MPPLFLARRVSREAGRGGGRPSRRDDDRPAGWEGRDRAPPAKAARNPVPQLPSVARRVAPRGWPEGRSRRVPGNGNEVMTGCRVLHAPPGGPPCVKAGGDERRCCSSTPAGSRKGCSSARRTRRPDVRFPDRRERSPESSGRGGTKGTLSWGTAGKGDTGRRGRPEGTVRGGGEAGPSAGRRGAPQAQEGGATKPGVRHRRTKEGKERSKGCFRGVSSGL